MSLLTFQLEMIDHTFLQNVTMSLLTFYAKRYAYAGVCMIEYQYYSPKIESSINDISISM